MPGILTRGKSDGSSNGLAPVAVVDIGSNSIRLVVYEGAQRAPTPVFNEKILGGLARGLDKSGRLSDKGVELALASLARFRALTDAMGVERVDVVATAAVREAENGKAFVADVAKRCGFKVRVLSGEEEARLAAAGVLSGIPEARGLIGDLGGGSVELVQVGDGGTGAYGTMPLGPRTAVPPRHAKSSTSRWPRWIGCPMRPAGGFTRWAAPGACWRGFICRSRNIRSTSFINTRSRPRRSAIFVK